MDFELLHKETKERHLQERREARQAAERRREERQERRRRGELVSRKDLEFIDGVEKTFFDNYVKETANIANSVRRRVQCCPHRPMLP